MLANRGLCATFLALVTLGVLLGFAARQLDEPRVMTRMEQQELSPEQVLEALKSGNQRFLDQKPIERDWLMQAKVTAEQGQFPKAVVLGCLDSRVPVEIVFDQGIGDLFVARVAGNVENPDLIGNFEFATAVSGAKLILVLGHTDCGAVKGAIDNVQFGNLTSTLSRVRPALADARRKHPSGTASDPEFVQLVIEENVRRTVSDIQVRSQVIADLVEEGDLVVVGAWYDLATGEVHWLD